MIRPPNRWSMPNLYATAFPPFRSDPETFSLPKQDCH